MRTYSQYCPISRATELLGERWTILSELEAVLGPLADWGARWFERQPEHADPCFVLWAWVHVHMRRDRLPERRTVVEFEFPDQAPPYQIFWMHIEPPEVELCSKPPGFNIDLRVTARSEAFTRWHLGELGWQTAVRRGEIQVEGLRALARALPTWNEAAT